MTFLNPLVLIGLAAAAIPLIVHLFNFRRPRRVAYSSLKFLRELRAATMQRVRIKRWLLLLLRTLAIAGLILAFARPTLQSGRGGVPAGWVRTSTVVVVDNSLSMTLRDAGGAYLDQAKDAAARLVAETDERDEIFVVTTAEGTSVDVEEIRADSRSTSASEAVLRAVALLRETASHANREILLVGDLQRSTLTDSAAAAVSDDMRVSLVPIGQRAVSNVAVSDVRVASRVVEAGQSVRVDATLVNWGSEAARSYVAGLYLEGERLAQATVDLPPATPVNVTFTVTPQERGWLAGTVEIEDDAFPEDNVRWFSLHVPRERTVLLVRGVGADAGYVELALSTRKRVAITTRSAEESVLGGGPLGAYDTVILVGVTRLSGGEISSLVRYVEEGGGLAVFPGEGLDLRDFNALLRDLGGGHVVGLSGAPNSGVATAVIDRVDMEHPLFEGVFDGKSDRVESPAVHHAIQYVPGADAEHTLIGLSDGFPFLQEIRKGRGATFIFASAPTPAWTDLPLRGLFVPLMYRSIFYLSAAESVQGERLTIGRPADVRLPGAAGGPLVRLVALGGEELIPEQRSRFGAVLIRIDGSLKDLGVLDVVSGETVLRRLALNLDTRESDLRVAEPGDAAALLVEATGLDVQAEDADPESVAAGGKRVELWTVFLMIVLCCLAAEMFVSARGAHGF